ncbi:hypothetical protein ACR42A_30945, partial [Burkholderia gladioli]
MAATAQDLPFRAFERETADSTRIDAVLAEASMLNLPAAVALLCDSDAFDDWPDATPESGERFLAAVRTTLSGGGGGGGGKERKKKKKKNRPPPPPKQKKSG